MLAVLWRKFLRPCGIADQFMFDDLRKGQNMVVGLRQRAGSLDRTHAERTVIPAAQFDGIGLQTNLAAPAVQAVLPHGRAGFSEGDFRLGVWSEAAVMVGNDHGVAAQACTGRIAAVFKIMEILPHASAARQTRGRFPDIGW